MLLFIDNLCNIDFSYFHPTRGLVGETWLASIELEGELNEQGMICDFGIVKQVVRQWLDEEVDHRLLVATQSTCAKKVATSQDIVEIHWQTKSGESYLCNSPQSAIVSLDAESTDARSLSAWCKQRLKDKLPSDIGNLNLRFTPEQIVDPFYHYSHGLKKHSGNCQRIAHGHRSKIEIWKNDVLDTGLIAAWAERWQDIYIGSKEDLTKEQASGANYTFAYRSSQGEFYLSIPKGKCALIDTDSTVEFLAQHIAQQLKLEHPNDHFKVKAYEGIGKGAVAKI
ncbi:MAG: hypothetical protein COA42_20865 [Alteromonadaceae bacterium]|nr:MAG: hypothetical protein COA42_20865 [Alteromonadaceae bacterium]